MDHLHEKYNQLVELLKHMEKVAVAFSGWSRFHLPFTCSKRSTWYKCAFGYCKVLQLSTKRTDRG